MKFSKQNILIGIIGLMLFSISIYTISQKDFYHPIKITIEARVETADVYQLFYNTGKGFNEQESIKLDVFPSDNFQKITFKIPGSSTGIQNFRIDPGYQTKEIYLKEISLKTNELVFLWGPEDILKVFSPNTYIHKMEIQNLILHIETSWGDPILTYLGNDLSTIGTENTSKKIWLYGISFLTSLLCLGGIFLFKTRFLNFLKSKEIFHNSNARFTIIFILLISIPLTQMIFRYLPEIENLENRKVAEFPNITLLNDINTWDEYTQSIETFFNDHYGLRSLLVRINSILEVKFLHLSPRPEVIIGKDGWLFADVTSNEEVSLQDFYGQALFSDTELITIKNNLINLEKKLKKQGTDLIIVLAANKHTLYNEFLPDSIQRKKGLLTRADQISSIAKELNLNYIDTRPLLMDAKSKYPNELLYYKTDTHWNKKAAFITYTEIIKTIRKIGHTIPYVYIENKEIDTKTVFDPKPLDRCDLSKLLNMREYKNTPCEIEHVTLNNSKYTTKDSGRISWSSEKITTTLNSTAYTSPKVLVFRDSFFVPLVEYMSESFPYITYIWSNNIDYTIIKNEKPDIVIVEFVERLSSGKLL
jgi:hypothetical protein